MSESEEPPTKVLKTNDEEALTDTTAASLTDASITETLDLPETTLPEVTDLPGIADLPEITDLPEVADLPAVAQESLDMAENISMEGTEMLEERLQDSVESEEAAESQEGQEEWLSEGILTDDDFNPAMESAPDSQTSQPEAFMLQSNTHPKPEVVETKTEQNIEDALNTLEGGPEKDVMASLDDFLIKKIEKTDANEAQNNNIKQEKDDGNDTDDLLRMLGDDGNKTKKLTKTVKDVRSAGKEASTDDDDYVFEAAAKKLKLSKSIAKVVPKAEPQDMEHSDQSSDGSETVQKMFSNKRNSKTQAKPVRYRETEAKSIVSVVERPRKEKIATSTPLPSNRVRSLLKGPRERRLSPTNTVQLKREPQHNTYSRKSQSNITSVPLKGSSILKTVEKKEEETINEEFLDENFHDDVALESDEELRKHSERMDEEEQSDESHSEDGSLYDELPSSESDDADDWFQLDIRAEKAGDYLPLLGQKAKQLLLEEKKRVASRLANLKQSLSALTDSGKKQAEQVRSATMTLAELDDMLKAS